MKKIYLILAAAIGMTITSCTSSDYLGEMDPSPQAVNDGSIRFGSNYKGMTRADLEGEFAAKALDYAFVVGGFKGGSSVTSTTGSTVFDNYNVVYPKDASTSNTTGWEYVGLDKNANSGATGPQTIKYWDYNKAQYDFIAYSLGNGDAGSKATVTSITPATATDDGTNGAYKLTGTLAQLKTVHIADLKTVLKANYDQAVVKLSFRPLVSKVRVGLYETIPGYSVRNVQFYDAASDASRDATAALYASLSILPTAGTYTVYFPTVNSDDPASDKNKAHVKLSSPTAASYLTFGAITGNYDDEERAEATGDIYLGRQSNERTWTGTAGNNYYTDVLPYEDGVALTLKVDYTLVSIDGTGEEINVVGATAVVPATYTKWLPGYAYTYIFKISDNTNGYTSGTFGTDAEGLHPITFDAVVVQTEEHQQETVTTVATPSITTYQADPHVNASANNEYKAGTVYAMVMNNGTPYDDLNGVADPAKDGAMLYTLSGLTDPTEADVMEALNRYKTKDGSGNITGLNTLVLTNDASNIDNEIADEDIPGPDGNLIEVEDGEASKLTVSAGTYAYVYTVTQATTTTTENYRPITTVAETTVVTGCYTYDGTTYTEITAADTKAVAGTTYYAKYSENNGVYAVKVIKVVS